MRDPFNILFPLLSRSQKNTNGQMVIRPLRGLFMSGIFSIVVMCFFSSPVFAQSCQDASVELSAEVQADPPRIILNWRANAGATQYTIYRKLKTSNTWGGLMATLDGAVTQFVDSTVSKGVSYEYRFQRQAAAYVGYGYINAGIEVPAIESRGILILVVDDTFKDSLAVEIERLKSDLNGDGWKVQQLNVSRTASVPSVKAMIVSTFNMNVQNTKALFLLGRVSVPYSGDLFPDGHGDHRGAWPADAYYGEMNGSWTDLAVNVTVANEDRHDNIPKDGKFDQSVIPSDVDLQVGRVDFANMNSFAASEQQLLKNYLDKDHAYRHKLFDVVDRGVVDDNFGYFGGEAFASTGWKNFSPLVGPDQVVADDYFTLLAASSYLWSYGCGGGWYQGAGGIGSTTDFAGANHRSVFTLLFGSYFGDWDSQNNFLRAPLAQGTTLTNAWSGRPHWIFHHMGLGENIGYSTRLTQNNSALYFSSYGARFIHIALMGDPTLRNHVVAPVSEVMATKSGYDAEITWKPSMDPVLGYNIYVKSDAHPDYLRLNEDVIETTSYTHSCLFDPGVYTYMVRAVLLQESPSGTYFNMSQGIADTLLNDISPEVLADASWTLSGNEIDFTNLSSNATSFEWSFGDGGMSTEENPTHFYLDGAFTATLIASNGCDADTFFIDVVILTGTEVLTDDPSVVVTPNPSVGKFSLIIDKETIGAAVVKIYSVAGLKVMVQKLNTHHAFIDVSSQPDGVYLMIVEVNGVRSLKRLVIQR